MMEFTFFPDFFTGVIFSIFCFSGFLTVSGVSFADIAATGADLLAGDVAGGVVSLPGGFLSAMRL